MATHTTVLAVLLALVALTGCGSESSDSDSANGDSKSAASQCKKAPPRLVKEISQGFTNSTFELHDAEMVAVPKDEQNDQGYPANMVAGNVTGKNGAGPSAVGVWAINVPRDAGPIFALNPGAKTLTQWGAAIHDGSPMAENRDIWASSKSAAAAEDCLS